MNSANRNKKINRKVVPISTASGRSAKRKRGQGRSTNYSVGGRVSGRATTKRFNSSRFIRFILIILFLAVVLHLALKTSEFVAFYRDVEIIDELKGKPAPLIDLGLNESVHNLIYIVEDDSQETHISFIAYFVYNTETSMGMVLYIPGWVYFEPSHAEISGSYRLADLLYISKLVQPASPYQLAINEIENNLAMEIDDYVWFKPSAFQHIQEISGNAMVVEGDSKNLETLLSTLSRISIFWNANSAGKLLNNTVSSYSFVNIWSESDHFNTLMNSGRFELLEINAEWGVVEDALFVGKTVKFFDRSAIDSAITSYGDIIQEKNIQKEQVKVEVYNASETSGLATRYTRWLQNSGIDVVRTDNSTQSYDKTTVYVTNPDRYRYSLKQVVKVLSKGSGHEIDEIPIVESRPEFLSTGDIVIVLGKDY